MEQEPSKVKGRILAIILLVFEVGIMFAYGFGGYFVNQTTTVAIEGGRAYLDYSDKLILYTFTAILAILGFGLLIAYSQNSALAGLTTTIIVISITVQLGPLLLSFWDQVFSGFDRQAPLSLQTERQSMVLCTSLLASLTSLIGRLGAIQTVLITFIYNIGWTFSFYLSQYISTKFAPASPPYPVVFDDNGTNYVYVFAGFFALITSLILNCRKGKSSPLGTRHSAYIGMIGTGFIFAAFPFTGILWPSQAAANPYRRFESPINIYFALTASVICTYISAAIFGKLKIGVRQSLVGILSGGVMVSVVSGTIYNIGACIAVGAFSGFISGFWLQVVHPRLNKNYSYDHMGIFGPILICSIFGGLVVAPTTYKAFLYQELNLNVLGNIIVSNYRTASYQIANIAIATGAGMAAGALAGLLCLIFRDPEDDFDFKKFVSPDFGLYTQEDKPIEGDRQDLAAGETNNVLNLMSKPRNM